MLNVEFRTCALLPLPHPPPFFPNFFFLFFFPDKEPFGAQRNIWKLVALRVTQHFIKREAISNHLSLLLSLTNDPEKPGSGSDPSVVVIPF